MRRKRLSKFIPKSSHLLLANCLIMSRVCYLIQVWGSAPKSQLKNVQIVINRAARFVTGLHKRTSTLTLMNACNWLPIAELVNLHSLISMWNVPHRQIPRQLYDEITTDNEMIISTSAPRLLMVAHSFRWKTVGLWNQMGQEIRTQLSLPKFKKMVKKWLKEQREIDPEE